MIPNFHQKNLQDSCSWMVSIKAEDASVHSWPMSQTASLIAVSKQPFTPATPEAEGVVQRASANHAVASSGKAAQVAPKHPWQNFGKPGVCRAYPKALANKGHIIELHCHLAQPIHYQKCSPSPHLTCPMKFQTHHSTSLDETTMKHSTLKPPSSNDYIQL